MMDNVNRPGHYTQGGIECIKAIKASMTPEAYKGYLKGNVLKYLWRYEKKNGLEDLEKASVYLNWLKDEVGFAPAMDRAERINEEIKKRIESAPDGLDF